MKKTTLLCCAALFGSLGLNANLVPNPGFELGNKTLEHWQNDRAGLVPADGNKVPGTRHTEISVVNLDGNRALLLESNGKEDAYALVRIGNLPVLKGFKYEVRFRYRAEGLMQESADRKQYTALIMDLFIDQEGKGNAGGCRIITSTNSAGWATLNQNNKHSTFFTVPDVPGKISAQIRFQLVNKYPNNPVKIWIDDVELLPLDTPLANPGFEDGTDAPANWSTIGAAKSLWVNTPVASGKKAVSVTDAPDGLFSGWTAVVPVRPDRQYRFSGKIKGGNLNPNGFVGGGALQIEFLDKNDNRVGKEINSDAVGANIDWKESATPFVGVPENAVKARLTAGLRYCNGTAYFDDLALDCRKAELVSRTLLKRNPTPAKGVEYAKNMLLNGDMEQEQDGRPANWTYVGKSDKNWTPEEVKRFHSDGRPVFGVGRGRGVWTTDEKYAGERSLLNISIDPPLSPNHQWYGRNPVDGFWLSDPVACEANKAYLAGGWIKPGAEIVGAWYGPLHILFYDAKGKEIPPANQGKIRTSMNGVKPGEWTYWGTVPYVAPANAATMRLRFGQELKADNGGWGMTYADNLALWESPAGPDSAPEAALNNRAYREWFIAAHKTVKPPYTASPAEAPAYISCWGRALNSADGNLFRDPAEKVKLKVQVFNQLGESRKLKVSAVRTDAYGAESKAIVSPEVEIPGASLGTVEIEMPPTKTYGAFHLDCSVYENDALVGSFSSRYAVLPELKRPHTVDNVFGVTTLYFHPRFDNNPHMEEMGRLLKRAGFGKAWVRCHLSDKAIDPAVFAAEVKPVLEEIAYFKRFGLGVVLSLHPEFPKEKHPRKVNYDYYVKIGEMIGRTFGDKVLAMGNFGIEQANSKSPYRGNVQSRLTDEEYDTIMAKMYDAIKSVSPQSTVCIGNIATDFEAATVKRLYKAPGNGKFDGAFFNAYMGQLMCAQNMVREFDAHGDTKKDVWSEEQANQRSPHEGEARRYGEIDGARNMVRTWINMIGKLGPRLRVVTIWGFAPTSSQDIMMMTPELQPRPQFVAHALMSDFLADATLKGDRSVDGVTLFEWARPDGPVFIGWADAGKRMLTLEAPRGELTEMDIMGNSRVLKAKGGLITLELDGTPRFFSGGGAVKVSDRVKVSVSNGTLDAAHGTLLVSITNNSGAPLKGTLEALGDGVKQSIDVEKGATKRLHLPLPQGLSANQRTVFTAKVTTEDGAVYAASGAFNFLLAPRAESAPALDGTWRNWEKAPFIPFGDGNEVLVNTGAVDETYTGKSDLYGRFRLLWDSRFLYLGVESEDDVFLPQKGRGTNGFMGDSIEFAFQPQAEFKVSAPKYEYEMYLPLGESDFVLSRRFPAPSQILEGWNGIVKPTGKRGNAVYQVAIPWSELGVKSPEPGKAMGFALILNDKDNPEAKYSGSRNLIRFFDGINGKNPELYGDLFLVQ